MKRTLHYLWGAALLILAAAPIKADRLLDIPLATQDNFDEYFTTVNLGDEGTMWKWDFYSSSYPAYAICYKYGTLEYNDYLTLKTPVHLIPNMAYRLSYRAACFENGSTSEVEVLYGTSSETDQLELLYKQTGIEFKNRYQGEEMALCEKMFEVAEEGDYYISFHAITSIAVNCITLDAVGNPSAPAVITDLAAVADPNYELKATVSFTVPSLTITGNQLESVSKVVIKRNGEEVATKTGYMPGDEVSWTDDNSVAGDVTYSVTVFSGELESNPAEVTVFVGPDVPLPVTGLTMTREAGVSTLSWTAPVSGAHGVEFDASQIRYIVERIVGGESTVIADAHDGVTYEDIFDSETRTSLSYKVTPFVGESVGESQSTSEIWIGAVSLPFSDSFAGASFGSSWETEILNGTKDWEVKDSAYSPNTTPQDVDGGFAWYNSYNASREYSARLCTPEILVASATNPVLEFWLMGNTSNYSDYIKLQIQKDGGEWTDVQNAVWYPNNIGKAEWAKYEVALKSAITDCSKFRIGFTAVSGYGYNMSVDNVKIYNLLEHDLQVVALNAPQSVIAGNDAEVSVSVVNKGVNTVEAGDYEVNVTAGDKSFSLQTVALAYGETHEFMVTIPVDASMASEEPVDVSAEVVYADDEDNDNNVSDTASMTYGVLDKPTVTVLDATRNPESGDISLEWSPAVNTEGFVATDLELNFESFELGYCGEATETAGTTMFGDWKAVVNGEYESAYWFYDLPSGFTIFDSSKTTSSYAPKGSSDSPQILMASGKLQTGSFDQWFISPELIPYAGAVYTVEFKMWPNDSHVLIEVAYSETDDNPESFIPVETFSAPQGSFMPKTAEVPGTAKYIALRHKSEGDGYTKCVAIDDIKIKSTCDVVLGYNVYEIGVGRVNDEPVAECSYVVTSEARDVNRADAEGESRVFAVSALYDGGESALGTAVTVVNSGVEAVNGDKPFALEGDVLRVYAAEADIYTIDGVKVGHVGTGAPAVVLSEGIYVIVVDGKSYKFEVR